MKKILIILLFACLWLSAVHTAKAATLETDYPVIGGKSLTGESDLRDFLDYAYTLGLSLVGLAAMGAFVWAGFLRMGSSIFKKEESSKWFWGAIIGVVLALASHLILTIINPDLVKLKLPGMPSAPSSSGTGATGESGDNTGGDTGSVATPNPNQAEEDELRDKLGAGNIGVYRGSCPGTCTQTSAETCDQCVNLAGIRDITYDGVLSMASACPNCNISIQGGTEGGHKAGTYSHANGYKLDTAKSSALNAFILNQSGSSVAEEKIDGYDTWYFAIPSLDAPDGKIYVRALKEGDHWDLRFTDKTIEPKQQDKIYNL